MSGVELLKYVVELAGDTRRWTRMEDGTGASKPITKNILLGSDENALTEEGLVDLLAVGLRNQHLECRGWSRWVMSGIVVDGGLKAGSLKMVGEIE